MAGKKIWLFSEVYSPDESGGAHFLTKLAEGLRQSYNPVNVLCGYPHYNSKNAIVPKREILNGVNVHRCQSTRFNKNIIVYRIFNLLTISVSIFLKALLVIRKQDILIVVTTPPLLPFVILIACKVRRAKCILRIEDVYPETLIATSILGKHSIFAHILWLMNKILYRSSDRITVLGRDMDKLVKNKLGNKDYKVSIIPNWADVDLVKPESKKTNVLLKKHGLVNKFIIQYAGNMGRAQGIENIFNAVNLLKNENDIKFMFIGSGSEREWMDNYVRENELQNILILDQRPRSDQVNFLNACDLGLVSLLPGMTGAGVPSRMYNIMAAGKPIIVVTGYGSEPEFVVTEEKVGWFVEAEKPEKLVEVILEARSNPECLLQMGKRARSVSMNKYPSKKIIKTYSELIDSIN